jgi:hypothetical protein
LVGSEDLEVVDVVGSEDHQMVILHHCLMMQLVLKNVMERVCPDLKGNSEREILGGAGPVVLGVKWCSAWFRTFLSGVTLTSGYFASRGPEGCRTCFDFARAAVSGYYGFDGHSF